MIGDALHKLLVRALPARSEGATPAPRLHALDTLGVLLRVGTYWVRGLLQKPLLGSSQGHFFVGHRTQLRHRKHLHVGRLVKIEDQAEIHALSERGVRLGAGVTIGRMACIRPSGYYGTDLGEGCEIGAGTAIGAFSWIGASGFVRIGEKVLFGPRVVVLPENHRFDRTDVPIKEQGVERAGITIEDDCWIGADVKILAGVHIGRGAVIAAGAVVTRDVPAGHVVGGVPARVLKERAGRDDSTSLRRSA